MWRSFRKGASGKRVTGFEVVRAVVNEKADGGSNRLEVLADAQRRRAFFLKGLESESKKL